MPQPLKQSLDQSRWLKEAEIKLRELENLVDSNLEDERLKPQLSMGEDVLSPEAGDPLHPNVRAPLSHVIGETRHDPPHLGNRDPARHKLGKLTGLYQMKGCEFNPHWKIPDISATNFSQEIINECPSRNWKYLTPAKFWPKSISYLPVHSGVKPKYPEFQQNHESLVNDYLNKLFEAGILYKRVSKHLVTFKGPYFTWEQKHLVPQQHGAYSSKINDRQESRRRRIITATSSRKNDSSRIFGAHNNGRKISYHSTRDGSHRLSGRTSDPTSRGALAGGDSTPIGPGSTAAHPSTHHVDRRRRQKGQGVLQAISREPSETRRNGTTSHHRVARCRTSSVEDFTRRPFTQSKGAYPRQGTRGTDPQGPKAHQQEENGSYLRGNTSWPNRVTGRIFLVDKNSRNTEEARLVVDFSQFSKGKNAMRFPKYWCPNLTTLRRILPVGMPRISLDLSQAFYHLPLAPASSSRLAVSDGKQVYYFRKAPMGVGLSPFLLHLFTTAIGAEIASRFNVWTFSYMDDFLLCHPSARHLNTISHAVCTFLQEFGIRINFDKMTPSPVTTIRFLGYEISKQHMKIEESRWNELRTVIKKIKVGQWYDWKCIQRFIGHLNFVLPFTKGNIEMLKPMYDACTHRVNFAFSSRYKILLYKLTMGVCKLTLDPKVSLPLPRVATDATLTHGAISHITGGSAVFTFSKVRDIHIQELLMVCLAKLMIKPRCILTDSTYVCHRKFSKLPWHFAMYAKQLLTRLTLYYVPSKYNPADGPTRHKPPDWTAVTYTPLSKHIYIPHRLCGL
ncbi:polymerase [Heron hepatitis B virus]|uniref:Protein P n=1 Tax=Heron hepatitis B virus TaxID=28300 RepID=DPOL_HHBV|nr:polymerase [Heron hepatitis B virus]P13846.1 RecName: Full=Protein P; Includes: RecName: Full=DNA-directed DNA polymerase; Includes: RecName: Full=RNA-directed DNA polymerase; Includes: RecName: Full=Ribonuclease H [Heron hepatitis B virus]AAA45738.1 polymerase [Heron hepatitis B virus]